MRYKNLFLVAFGLLLVTPCLAQFHIRNYARAEAYNPALSEDLEEINDSHVWGAFGGESHVSALSDSHNFDPPVNVAKSFSEFKQPQYEDATLRAQSFVISDYSGIGSTQGYKASTEFSLQQSLVVEVIGFTGNFVDLKAIVPMHGLMAAYGNGNPVSGGISSARAESRVSAFSGNGTLLDETVGSLSVESADYNEFVWSATGDWAGRVDEKVVDLPTGEEPRQANGVELSGFELISLGQVPTGTFSFFTINFDMSTTASIASSTGMFSMADFSGTGGYQFVAFDENGQPFHDFTVNVVPEPCTILAMTGALLGVVRRRRASRTPR